MPVSETILVVEDSRPNRNILVKLLKKIGYEVLEASDGHAALQLVEEIEKKADHKLIAILSDIMMPRVDGLALLREVRRNDNYKNLPFVFITAMADSETVSHAQDLKVNGYLLKPITLHRVVTKLQELFPSKVFTPITGT